MAITFLDPFQMPQATFGRDLSLENPAIETPFKPLTTIFVGTAPASLARTINKPVIDTVKKLITRVKGRVKLQGRDNSLGGFVEVATEVYFVDPDGSFEVEVPPDSAIYIHAPGYVSTFVPEISATPGGLITLPALTLYFGDANGDGRIDIYDLNLAAGNFGGSLRPLPAP